MKQSFWQKNQVFISGIASAIILALQPFVGNEKLQPQAITLAALIAIAGYLGNELRGKGVTIAGFAGIAANAFYTLQTTGHFTWQQFGFSVLIGALAVVAAPAKPASYEQSPTIQQAKDEAQTIKEVNKNTPPPQL